MNDVSYEARLEPDVRNRRLRSALMAFFVRRIRDRTEAEDLTQEVFSRLAAGRDDGPAPHDAYIFRIAANLLTDRARREAVRRSYREERRLEDHIGIDPLDPFRVAVGHEELSRLSRAIADLPDKTRRIFILYRIENIDKTAIADSFGLSSRMVEIHIRRALDALSLCMELGA